MSWEDIDNKIKKAIDRDFVSCDETYELSYIKTAIKKHYGSLVSDNDIDAAIKHCCNAIKPPRKREDFSKCIKNKLG